MITCEENGRDVLSPGGSSTTTRHTTEDPDDPSSSSSNVRFLNDSQKTSPTLKQNQEDLDPSPENPESAPESEHQKVHIVLDQDPQDRYELMEKLGEGSYGSVYKAVDRVTADVVALKIVPVNANDPHEMSELEKEISILSQCSSVHIVQYHGAYLYNGDMYIAMEFCAAGSCLDLMHATQTCLEEAEIAAICASVVLGLEYLHAQNNIHRDVKAGNILLSQSGHGKLSDFGVSAQLSGTMAKRKTVIGTPFWMGPEVIQASSYDCKADIWSLGITVIELAEGDPPHAQMHPMRAIFLIPSRPSPTLRHPESVSRDMNDFLAQCLEKDPTERPSATSLRSHPFIARHVSKLVESSASTLKDSGIPVLQELVEKSLDAIADGRRGEDSEEDWCCTTTTTPPNDQDDDDQNDDQNDDLEDIRDSSGDANTGVNVSDYFPNRSSTWRHHEIENYGTMVFKGRPAPEVMKRRIMNVEEPVTTVVHPNSSALYGTMIIGCRPPVDSDVKNDRPTASGRHNSTDEVNGTMKVRCQQMFEDDSLDESSDRENDDDEMIERTSHTFLDTDEEKPLFMKFFQQSLNEDTEEEEEEADLKEKLLTLDQAYEQQTLEYRHTREQLVMKLNTFQEVKRCQDE